MNSVKKKKQITYIDHQQNSSPAKISYSFRKNSRFEKHTSFSPNKFYDLPQSTTKRSTFIGFGNKTNFINRESSDPGRYNVKSAFDNHCRKNGINFGISHEKFYEKLYKKKVGPGPNEYKIQPVRKINFYIGKGDKFDQEKVSKVGPQTYNFQERFLERISKYQGTKTIKMKTEYHQKSIFDEYDNKNPGPGSYNPQVSEFWKKTKNKKQSSFSKAQKLKLPKPSTNLGPGHYRSFSVFGGD